MPENIQPHGETLQQAPSKPGNYRLIYALPLAKKDE